MGQINIIEIMMEHLEKNRDFSVPPELEGYFRDRTPEEKQQAEEEKHERARQRSRAQYARNKNKKILATRPKQPYGAHFCTAEVSDIIHIPTASIIGRMNSHPAELKPYDTDNVGDRVWFRADVEAMIAHFIANPIKHRSEKTKREYHFPSSQTLDLWFAPIKTTRDW